MIIPDWLCLLILLLIATNMISLLTISELDEFPYLYILKHNNINIFGKILFAVVAFPFLFPGQALVYVCFGVHVVIIAIAHLFLWIFAKDKTSYTETYKDRIKENLKLYHKGE